MRRISREYTCIPSIFWFCGTFFCINVHRYCEQVRRTGVGSLDPLKICRRVRVCLDPKMSRSFIIHAEHVVHSAWILF